jgi:hypothetical protein
MISTTQPKHRVAVYALALGVAGTGSALAHADARPADTASLRAAVEASHQPVRGNYPGTYFTRQAKPQALSTAEDAVRASRQPVAGNYPGTYEGLGSTLSSGPAAPSGRGFIWVDAGIGAAVAVGAVLLLAAFRAMRLRARRRGLLRGRA